MTCWPNSVSAVRSLVIICWLCAATTLFAEDIDPVLIEKLAETMAEDFEAADRYDTEVWLKASDARLKGYVDSHDERLALLHTVYREAQRQNLDPDLVLAVMQVESAFDRYAVSRVGAQGLMQVMPFWRLEIGRHKWGYTHRRFQTL